jgi:hypothetical protein
MSKKWYNFFVTVDQPGGGSSGPDTPPSDDAAQTVAQIAASLKQPEPPPTPRMQAAAATVVSTPKNSATPPPTASFNEIYEAAEIRPGANGYSIFKVSDMLQSEHIRNLPAEVKRSSVLVALEAAGVKLADIIDDAVRRYRALDTFERLQQKQVDDYEAAKSAENRKIQEEMDRLVAEYRAKIQANNEDVGKRREALNTWRFQKQIEEQKIADAVSYFVTENPITTTGRNPAPPSPAKPAGI